MIESLYHGQLVEIINFKMEESEMYLVCDTCETRIDLGDNMWKGKYSSIHCSPECACEGYEINESTLEHCWFE